MGDRDDQLAACGYDFRIRRDLAHMPDAGPMRAREPVSAELCEVPVQVTLAEAPPLSDLDVGQFGAYRFDASKATIWIRRPALQSAWEIEALNGPVLLHALAQRNVFVLHSSAARTPGGALVAFTAASGVGKSTLARVAAEIGWQRIGDDLLPIFDSAGRTFALPHFQQPKLADSEQYAGDAPPTLPLAAIVHLSRSPVAGMEHMAPKALADLLLSNTVATRVFSSRSLELHLAFAAKTADEVSAGRLIAARLTLAERPDDVAGAAREALSGIAAALDKSRPPPP